MIKILIDPGHGEGKDYNRGGLYFNEGDNNYYYSLILKKELEKYQDVKVDLTRKDISQNPSLSTRSSMGAGYDLFISEHSNGANGKARGTEAWDSVEKPNKALAQAIVDCTSKLFNHSNRGVKYKEGQPGYNWYGVLRFNKAKSAMIIENGFHDNTLDGKFFKDNHQKIAQAQAQAIANHYKLKLKGGNIVATPNINNNIPSAWAKDDWNWGIKVGITDGSNPKGVPTREQVVAMIKRAKEDK